MPPREPSTRKTKVGKDVTEVIEPEIKRARFSTIVEETISTNPDEIWSIFILAPIQKMKKIVTAIQMLVL